jgi:hypothetical protein
MALGNNVSKPFTSAAQLIQPDTRLESSAFCKRPIA